MKEYLLDEYDIWMLDLMESAMVSRFEFPNANEINIDLCNKTWELLGKKHGFKWQTVKPINPDDNADGRIMAEPV